MSKEKSNPTSPRSLTLVTHPVLPEHFAENVLEYETELDLDCNISTILKLMELYSSAIEHYESKSDPKYLHYQERLHNLLARKDVITLLNVGSPTAISRLSPGEILKKMQEEVALRQRYRSHQVNLYMTQCLPEHRDIEKMIVKHRSENNLASAKLKENLRNQEHFDFESRVEERKNRSGTPVAINRTLSFNSIKNNKIEKYQEEIENIVEKCVEERDVKIKEIKKKYKEEIKQVRVIGGEDAIINMVIDQMKQNLKSEVHEIEKLIRQKKKEMIEEIKIKYY